MTREHEVLWLHLISKFKHKVGPKHKEPWWPLLKVGFLWMWVWVWVWWVYMTEEIDRVVVVSSTPKRDYLISIGRGMETIWMIDIPYAIRARGTIVFCTLPSSSLIFFFSLIPNWNGAPLINPSFLFWWVIWSYHLQICFQHLLNFLPTCPHWLYILHYCFSISNLIICPINFYFVMEMSHRLKSI